MLCRLLRTTLFSRGQLDVVLVVGNRPLYQLDGLAGNHGAFHRLVAAKRRAGPLLHGQATAIGANPDNRVLRQFEEHAAERVMAALGIGGEHRAADHLAKEAGRNLVVTLFLKGGDIGKLIGVFRGQLELAPLSIDARRGAVAFDRQFLIGRFAEDHAPPFDRQDNAPTGLDLNSRYVDSHAHFQVGGHQCRNVGDRLELDVLQDRLRGPGNGDSGGNLECLEQSLAFTNEFHSYLFFNHSIQQ